MADLGRDVIPLRLVNIGDKPKKVYEETFTATCEPVSRVLSYEDSVVSSNTSHSDINIPDHLVDLYKSSSCELSKEQTIALANLLVEQQHVFSKSGDDLGCVTGVQHNINTGSAAPIKQRPRRQALAKREDEKAEVHRMMDLGIIEQSTSP